MLRKCAQQGGWHPCPPASPRRPLQGREGAPEPLQTWCVIPASERAPQPAGGRGLVRRHPPPPATASRAAPAELHASCLSHGEIKPSTCHCFPMLASLRDTQQAFGTASMRLTAAAQPPLAAAPRPASRCGAELHDAPGSLDSIGRLALGTPAPHHATQPGRRAAAGASITPCAAAADPRAQASRAATAAQTCDRPWNISGSAHEAWRASRRSRVPQREPASACSRDWSAQQHCHAVQSGARSNPGRAPAPAARAGIGGAAAAGAPGGSSGAPATAATAASHSRGHVCAVR